MQVPLPSLVGLYFISYDPLKSPSSYFPVPHIWVYMALWRASPEAQDSSNTSLPSQETPPLIHSRITFNFLFLIQHRKVSDHPITCSIYTLFVIREIVGMEKYYHWNVQKERIHSTDTARKCCEWWKAKRNQLQCVGIKPSSVLPQEDKNNRKQTLELLQKETGHLRHVWLSICHKYWQEIFLFWTQNFFQW